MAHIPLPSENPPPEPEIPLSKLSRAQPNMREILQINDPKYLQTLDDRALAIIDAASLERALEQAIIEKVRPLSQTELNNLFIGDGAPLGTLSAKIKVGYAFSVFGQNTKNELDRIRVIRNQFAHSPKPITFATASVKSACANLASAGRVSRPDRSFYSLEDPWPPTDARLQYHFSVQALDTALVLINEERSHIPELNEMYLPLD